MAGLHFDITGDNSNFLRKLREVETGVTNTSKEIEKKWIGHRRYVQQNDESSCSFWGWLYSKRTYPKYYTSKR